MPIVPVLSCAVVDYNAARAAAIGMFSSRIGLVRSYVTKFQKTQHAAETALDM